MVKEGLTATVLLGLLLNVPIPIALLQYDPNASATGEWSLLGASYLAYQGWGMSYFVFGVLIQRKWKYSAETKLIMYPHPTAHTYDLFIRNQQFGLL